MIRAVREELGLDLRPGRLLVVDYLPAQPDRTESIVFVFDGGILDEATIDRITLPEDELRS